MIKATQWYQILLTLWNPNPYHIAIFLNLDSETPSQLPYICPGVSQWRKKQGRNDKSLLCQVRKQACKLPRDEKRFFPEAEERMFAYTFINKVLSSCVGNTLIAIRQPCGSPVQSIFKQRTFFPTASWDSK